MGFGDQDVDDFWGHSSGSAFLCSPMLSLYSAWKTQKVMFLSFLPPAQGKAHKQAFSCFYRVVTKGAGWGSWPVQPFLHLSDGDKNYIRLKGLL